MSHDDPVLATASGAPSVGGPSSVVTGAQSVADVLASAAVRFSRAGITTPRTDARLLLRHALGWSAAALVIDATTRITAAQAAAVAALVDRRAAREPLQLLLGSVGFRTIDVEVRPGVFIPRPETELLAGLAIERVPRGGTVVEPCTGSGAVACAIAVERPDVSVLAGDVDAAAVALARHNAARVGATVTVAQASLIDMVPDDLRGRADVLVANPPYLAENEVETLEPEVRWDPRMALVAGPTGHEISDRLIAAATTLLRPGGWLLLELDERRVASASRRAARSGLTAAAVHDDLAHRPRYLAARRST